MYLAFLLTDLGSLGGLRRLAVPAHPRRRFVRLQGDLFAHLAARVRASAIGSYGHANRYIWSRAGLMYEVTPRDRGSRVRLAGGIELTAQGNRDTPTQQVGGVAELLVAALTRSMTSPSTT